MPAWVGWALRGAGAILSGDDLRKIVGFLLLVALAVPLALLLLPFLAMGIPLMPDTAQGTYLQAVQAVLAETSRAATDHRGVAPPWEWLAAIDAVRRNQDFGQVTEAEAEALAWHFVERHDSHSCPPGGGNPPPSSPVNPTRPAANPPASSSTGSCAAVVTFSLRPLDEVLAELGIAGMDAERVREMIQALQDAENQAAGGVRDYTPDPLPGWTWPVPGHTTITSPYGWRTLGGRRDFHPGIDVAVPTGTEVLAAHAGIVTQSGPSGACGNALAISWPGGEVRYCHNSVLLVPVGTEVALGQAVSLSGNTGESTGPHLHIEVYEQGHVVDPMSVFGYATGGGGYLASGKAVPVPPEYVPWFQQAARSTGVAVSLLESVARIESGFDPRAVGPLLPGGLQAQGMMQMLPSTFQAYAVDANGNGSVSPFDPADAIFAAARMLAANGAATDPRQAIYVYNRSWAYVDAVLRVADEYAQSGGYAP